jgi:hypothetical protein
MNAGVNRPSRGQLLSDSWRRFTEVLPEMRQPWCAAAVWGGVTLAAVVCLLLGRTLASARRAAPLVEAAFLLWAGAWMLAGFWSHRAAYRERYGVLAYQHLFFRFLLPFFVGGIAAIYFPVLVDGERFLPPVIADGVAAYLLVTMQLMEVRGREIFWDIEWRAFVYNVFPERGRVVTAGIFHWLRHPVYSAGIRLTLALALLRNNSRAISCATLLALAHQVLAFPDHGEGRGLRGSGACGMLVHSSGS